MTVSLFDALVPSWIQVLESMSGLMDKAEHHCAVCGVEPQVLINARLALDMRPLSYQVKAAISHSSGAINAVRRGRFSPDLSWPESFGAMKGGVDIAIEELSALDKEEVNAFADKDLLFMAVDYQAEFTAENFLLSFSLPNFYFHTSIGYAILRAQGLDIGKIDYLGRLRKKC